MGAGGKASRGWGASRWHAVAWSSLSASSSACLSCKLFKMFKQCSHVMAGTLEDLMTFSKAAGHPGPGRFIENWWKLVEICCPAIWIWLMLAGIQGFHRGSQHTRRRLSHSSSRSRSGGGLIVTIITHDIWKRKAPMQWSRSPPPRLWHCRATFASMTSWKPKISFWRPRTILLFFDLCT